MLKSFLKMCFLFGFVYTVDYCKLTCEIEGKIVQHTACGCTVDRKACCIHEELDLSLEEKEYMVQLHNEARQSVAKAENASNMNTVTYDSELEYAARCWLRKCQFVIENCRKTEKFQLFQQHGFKTPITTSCQGKETLREAFNLWFSQQANIQPSCIEKYPGSCDRNEIYDYALIVWAHTTHIGCARTSHNGTECRIFCNYGPAGDIIGDSVYESGQRTCEIDTNYPNLCKGSRGSYHSVNGPARNVADDSAYESNQDTLGVDTNYTNLSNTSRDSGMTKTTISPALYLIFMLIIYCRY